MKPSLSSPPRITMEEEPGTSLEVGQHRELRSLGFGVTEPPYEAPLPRGWCEHGQPHGSDVLHGYRVWRDARGCFYRQGEALALKCGRHLRTHLLPCRTIVPIGRCPVGQAWRCCARRGRLLTGLSVDLSIITIMSTKSIIRTARIGRELTNSA